MNKSRSFEDFEEKHLDNQDLKLEAEFQATIEEESQLKDYDSFPSSSSSFRMKFVEAQMVDSISDISDNIFPNILEKKVVENREIIDEMDDALHRLQEWKINETLEFRGEEINFEARQIPVVDTDEVPETDNIGDDLNMHRASHFKDMEEKIKKLQCLMKGKYSSIEDSRFDMENSSRLNLKVDLSKIDYESRTTSDLSARLKLEEILMQEMEMDKQVLTLSDTLDQAYYDLDNILGKI